MGENGSVAVIAYQKAFAYYMAGDRRTEKHPSVLSPLYKLNIV